MNTTTNELPTGTITGWDKLEYYDELETLYI